jgi:hypothetical protein
MTIENYEQFKYLVYKLRPLTVPYNERAYADPEPRADNLTKKNSDIYFKKGSLVVLAVLTVDKDGLNVHKKFNNLYTTTYDHGSTDRVLDAVKQVGAYKPVVKALVEESREFKRVAADVELVRSAPAEWWSALEKEEITKNSILKGFC